MPRTRRPILRTFGLMLAGLVVGSLAIELYLRLAEFEPFARVLPAAQASLYGPDPDTGYAHRPGAKGLWLTENRAWVEINGLGLRDNPSMKSAKSGQRLGIVGDSFVEALQVPIDDTFPQRAELALQRGLRFERVPVPGPLLSDSSQFTRVMNLGLAGATPAVTVQRLNSLAPRLDLDAAIVILDASNLLRQRPDDTSEFVGYVPGPDGKAVLSHAFRETRGYKLRSGPVGRAMYWLLDHSRLALLLNNRKNVGILAELAEPPRPALPIARTCTAETLKPHEELWSGKPTGFAQARLDAILSDLDHISRSKSLEVLVALRGLSASCPNHEEKLVSLKAAVAERVAKLSAARRAGTPTHTDPWRQFRGVRFFDIEAAAARHIPPGKTFADLTGWGPRIGTGHLNELGHQIYAAAIVELLTGKAR